MQSRPMVRAAAPGRRGGVRGAPPAGAGHARRLPREPAPRREPRALGPSAHAGHHLPRRGLRTRMTLDLFDDRAGTRREPLAPGAVGAARLRAARTRPRSWPACTQVVGAAPLRHMVTPGGFRMSVAMTNCGALGWVIGPQRLSLRRDRPARAAGPGRAMPAAFARARRARPRPQAGFDGFAPDACLVNRYEPGTRLSLHQDHERARLRRADRVGVARHAGGVPVRRRDDGPTRRAACRSRTATWWCGAARRGCTTTACCRSTEGQHPLLGRHAST